jgi:hypothetical protein
MTLRSERGLSTYQALRRVAEQLVAPVDIDQLVANGVLRVRGRWFEVLDITRLPEAAKFRILALRAPNLVKFRKPGKRLVRSLKRTW